MENIKVIEKRKRIRKIDEYKTFKSLIEDFPKGILSLVSDTFNLWEVLTKTIPSLKKEILAREGKLVIRPDSGDPVDVICGLYSKPGTWNKEENGKFYHSTSGFIGDMNQYEISKGEYFGVIELLWEIFGGTINEQGYKVLDPHIGAIYGDSINLERQVQIYSRLANKQFAATNIVVGVGSFTYVMLTRDSAGYAAKGAWFEINDGGVKTQYNIYKDPVTGKEKKSLKGFQFVYQDENGEYQVESEVSEEKAFSDVNLLKTIYKDGKFYNQTTLTEIREKLNKTI